jgi:TRAP-type C4-dicarboxylate transport system permease small subunit
LSGRELEGGSAGAPRPAAGIVLLLAAAIRWWALAGGLLTAALAVMTALSALSNLLFAKPFPADYELMKHFIAVVIFMFLPYCQLTGSNVTVDIFTEGMSERGKAAMAVFSSFIAAAFAIVLMRQMGLGLLSYIRYREVTPVLHLPLWTAFPPILLSLALLLAAASITALDGWRVMRGLTRWIEEPQQPPVE